MRFEDFGLTDTLLKAVQEEGYTQPTPIQESAMPHVLKGKDLLGCAQTGTGKTAAFALPILQRLGDDKKNKPKHIRALIITPTRELAAQIDESFNTYGRHTSLRSTVVFGGVRQRAQTQALKKGVDILVATPGRLIDLTRQGHIKLDRVEILVLDEADRMLDMGFIDDIRWIVDRVPKKRQTLLFSATMPSRIQHLANSILTDPVDVRLPAESPAADTVGQSVYFVERSDKQALLQHILEDDDISRALIFTRTKRNADRVTDDLKRINIKVDVIHADKPQSIRQRALERFKEGKIRVLVASDIAARGIDVDNITHVINFDVPQEAEVYVHRIGRTGRAGATGRAVSFCDIEERTYLDEIERLLRRPIEPIATHPYPSPLPWSSRHTPRPVRTGVRKPLRRRLGRRR